MKKRILCLILCGVLIIGLTGCGSTGNSKESNTQKETKKVTFYEDYSELPDLKNITEFKSESQSKTVTGNNAGTITITYIVNDGDNTKNIIEKYLKLIEEYKFTNKMSGDTSYSIIYEEMIVAEISNDENTITLKIIPKENQLSSKIVELKPNETITTDDYEFTLTKVEFSYDVKPSDTSSVYMSYPAESGKVYIDTVVKIKNLMERDIRINELYTVKAVYADKYNYDGFVIIDTGNDFDWVSSYSAASPLETVTSHGLVDCPDEVSSSANSLYVDFVLADGITYRYTIR